MNYEKLTADQANRVFYAFANALAVAMVELAFAIAAFV